MNDLGLFDGPLKYLRFNNTEEVYGIFESIKGVPTMKLYPNNTSELSVFNYSMRTVVTNLGIDLTLKEHYFINQTSLNFTGTKPAFSASNGRLVASLGA